MKRFLAILLAGALLPAALPPPARAQTSPSDPAPPSARLQVSPAREGRSDLESEQGRTALTESFQVPREVPLETKEGALEDTQFRFNFRTMYFDRDRFDGSSSRALATGGWVGAKTGYFLERFSLGATGYTSQRIDGDPGRDGTGMLKPGQAGYSVLGEAYADVVVARGLHLYAGRREIDTAFANRSDVRMTPNTFEAIVLQGLAEVGSEGATVKYGVGYLDKIKNRNDDRFVSMAVDAGAAVERGVLAGGALYTKDAFSIGAIDYYSPDVINIFYAESRMELPFELPFADNSVPRLGLQFVDQRSTGDELLTGAAFSAQQFGVRSELPVGDALFSVGYTLAGSGADLRSPWSGYPGYTGAQVEDFNRAGEGALLLRAAYELPWFDGVSAYALFVNGGTPDDPAHFRKNELDLNLEWAPSKNLLKGLSLRIRYAIVEEYGPMVRDLGDFRVISNFGLTF
jgi:hypothetical protein